MTVKSREILEQIRPEDKNLLTEKELVRRFGRQEDCVELHIYDLNGKLLDSIYNFEDYEIPSIDDAEGYYNEITFNPDKALRDLGYNTGEYNLRVNFHRRKIANTLENLFYINTISPSRTELRVKIKNEENLSSLIFATNQFIAELGDTDEGVTYFKDFALNLGDDIVLTGVNFIAEQGQNNSFLIKLYEPLPNTYSEKTQFRIIEELTNPINYRVDLGTPEITVSSTELRGPNLRIDTRLNSSIPTTYRAYNDILSYSSSGSLNNVLNALSASIPISVEYDNPNTDSGYVYDKFIHFSSAEERLRNFKYKLELIELYTSRSAYMEGLTPAYVTANLRQQNEGLKNQIIQNFDGYERYLYYESGTYAWPKSNDSKPYTLYSTTASEATTWFNTNVENAEDYDGINSYILRNTLPQYIIDNDQNEHMVTFVDMIGQYFDNIWLYIENITDKNIAHNSLTEGISKDLVFEALKERGIPAFDQFENANLFEYLLAADQGSDNFVYQAPSGQTMVTGSNESTPKGDISKEVWKRLYHNAPYLLKTKGTERGVKALLACYGIPESILHVKEYGGPAADKTGFRTFKYPKLQKALHVSTLNSVSPLEFTLPQAGTIEFTIIPQKVGEKNVILTDANGADAAYLYIESSSIYEESGKLRLFNPFKLLLDEDFPYYTGLPITFYLNKGTNTGGYEAVNIKATTYIDGEYIEESDTVQFNTTNLKFGPSSGMQNFTNESGSLYLQNFKYYNEELNAATREIHTKDPNIIADNGGNLDNLKYYAPLGANLKEDTLTAGLIFPDQSGNSYIGGGSLKIAAQANVGDLSYVEVDYNHFISTPDTVGSSMASEKVRYDQGTIADNILSPTVRAEESTLDRQPQDFSNLGVFFSPTFEINEDIIHTLGGFRLDDYIGNPSHLTGSEYPDLKTLRDTYADLKIERRYNFWDYLKTIQYFDHTVFKIIEEFVPAKANLKTGLVIEPHYLERPKLNYYATDFSRISFPDINYTSTTGSIEAEYLLHTCSIDVEQVLDGSGGTFENNFVYGRLSSKYYRVAENRQ